MNDVLNVYDDDDDDDDGGDDDVDHFHFHFYRLRLFHHHLDHRNDFDVVQVLLQLHHLQLL